MNALLTPTQPVVPTAGAPVAGSALAGIAARLAQTLPAGASVRVEWRHPVAGRGSDLSFGGALLVEHVLEDEWKCGDGGQCSVVASNPAQWPEGIAPHWLTGARALVESALREALAQLRIRTLERSELVQQALYQIADLAGGALEPGDMLRRIHLIIGELMYAENFYIAQFDEQRQTVRFAYFVDQLDPWVNDPDEEILLAELGETLTSRVLTTGETLRGSSRDLRQAYGIPIGKRSGPDSADWLGVPMCRDERVVGALIVQHYENAGVYSEDDRILLAFVAQHVLTALDRRQQRDQLEARVAERTSELQRANEELQVEVLERRRMQEIQRALFRIAELSTTSETMTAFYAEIHNTVSGLLYARNFYVAVLSADGSMLEFPYSVDERDIARTPRPTANGLSEYVLRNGQPLLVDRAGIQDLERTHCLQSHGSLAQCWLGVPLLHEEQVVGVIAVQSYSPEVMFTARDQDLLTFVAFHIGSSLARKQAQDRLLQAHANLERRVGERTRELADTNAELVEQIGERVRAERRLTHQALHDALTGLPNRTQLLDRLAAAIAGAGAGGSFAVLFMDLDRFKLVNDSVGHAVGDELLIEAGRRIVASVREGDVVARLGGDEFAILAFAVGTPELAEELARRILHALSAPVWVAGKELFPSASIGIALWHPRYGTGEEMLRDADAAMYRAKGDGRDRCALFDERMHLEATRSLDMEADMRRAIQAGAFLPHYQPIVRLDDATPVGREALLRWEHETAGLLCPGDFLDIGEESGLIEQIDWLIYARVIEDMARRPDVGYVAINVSPRHFRIPDFATRLLGLLDAAAVPPSRLRIEITEVALLDDAPRTRETLDLLRRHGVLAQLDDFGTGFSALSYLHRFPIASLKIDRSFVAGLDDDSHPESVAVIRAIVALAGSLGIELIAEGVETEHQRERLADLGCVYAQGYLFGRPAAAG